MFENDMARALTAIDYLRADADLGASHLRVTVTP